MTEALGEGTAALAQAQVQALVGNAKDLGLTWTLRPATVTGYDGAVALAILDGDTVPIAVTVLIDAVDAGQRVYVLIIPPGGNYVIGRIPSQVGVRARVTNSQAVANAVQTTLVWNVVDAEDGGDFLTVGGSTITVPESGLWAVSLRTSLAAGGGARNFLNSQITTSVLGVAPSYRSSFVALEPTNSLSFTIPLLAGDSFNGSIYQEGGANTVSAWLTAYRVGGFAEL